MPGNRDFIKNYNKYKDKIYTYIWYRVNFNEALSEDLCSEVFIKAYKNFDKFLEIGTFQAWIYTICKNHLANYYRQANREVELDFAKDKTDDIIEKMHISFELKDTLKKIQNLDGVCKEILLMRFVDGLDNREIAKILDKEEGAVRTQISRALKKLRGNIKKYI